MTNNKQQARERLEKIYMNEIKLGDTVLFTDTARGLFNIKGKVISFVLGHLLIKYKTRTASNSIVFRTLYVSRNNVKLLTL